MTERPPAPAPNIPGGAQRQPQRKAAAPKMATPAKGKRKRKRARKDDQPAWLAPERAILTKERARLLARIADKKQRGDAKEVAALAGRVRRLEAQIKGLTPRRSVETLRQAELLRTKGLLSREAAGPRRVRFRTGRPS